MDRHLETYDSLKIFTKTIGIQEPFYIQEASLDATEMELHVEVGFRRDASFSCPTCGAACGTVDAVRKTFRHLSFFQFSSYIHLSTPQCKCGEHGYFTPTPDWAVPGSGYTVAFEKFVTDLALRAPVARVAAVVGETDKRVSALLKRNAAKDD